jgi:GH25 family lysozyme M1 (1,4-beta-N-acetylmuramidase)
MRLRRSWLTGVVAGVVAGFVAVALLPLAPPVAAAASDYAANCSARLRDAPSTSATAIVTMPTDTVVTTAGIVTGGSWSTTCVTDVAGSTWYQITAVNGTSVSMLYGVSVAYAATGLFRPATSPPPPPATYLEGIDVSRYQDAIDWAGVASAGKRFAIMRATLGDTYLDPTYATNHAGARAAGLQVSAYHFATPSSSPGDAALEADWFVRNAALLPGDLVPALDLEQTGGLAVSDLQAWVGTWLGEVTARLGVRPMIYTSPNFWKNSMGDTTMFADQGYSVLWIAHWATSSPTVPAANWGGQGWTFWQYSNCGSVTGISGCVDLDRYHGTDLAVLTLGPGYLPPVAPPNAPPILSAISPAAAPAAGGDLTISIEGAGFAPGISTAYWNALPLTTTYVSPTQLLALVPAAHTAAPGTNLVAVYTQPPGGGTSVSAAFAVTPPTVDPAAASLPKLEIGARSALGLAPAAGYTATTPKTARVGTYVTWRFSGGAALAGQRVNVLVATRVNGAWSSPKYLASRWADANGTVTFSRKSGTATAINVRVQWPGSDTHGSSTSRALGAYWK